MEESGYIQHEDGVAELQDALDRFIATYYRPIWNGRGVNFFIVLIFGLLMHTCVSLVIQ